MPVDPKTPLDKTVPFTTAHVNVETAVRAELNLYKQVLSSFEIDRIATDVVRRIKTT